MKPLVESESTLLPLEPVVEVAPPLDVEGLLAKAIEANVPIETLERLVLLREKLTAERARAAFFAALAAFQGECPIIGKDTTARIGDKYTYRYATLDAIVREVRPFLLKHGLSATFRTMAEDTALTKICTVHHVLGHTEASSFTVPIDPTARMNDAQKVASASTYAKRYAFCDALGILTGDADDDAQALNSAADEKFPRLRGAKATPATAVAADLPTRITPGQHKALEKDIRDFATAAGQDETEARQRVKDKIGKEFGKEHFPDLSVDELAKVHQWIGKLYQRSATP